MPTVLYLGQLATRAQKQLNSLLTVVHPRSLKTKKLMLELISLIVFKHTAPSPTRQHQLFIKDGKIIGLNQVDLIEDLNNLT